MWLQGKSIPWNLENENCECGGEVGGREGDRMEAADALCLSQDG